MALYRVRTDMQLKSVYDIPTNFHSRTRLPQYSHVAGGQTPATIRLQGGKGNVQYPAAWITYVEKILNDGDPAKGKYLFHEDSGIQNSSTKGRMEEVTCEGNVVDVVAITGRSAFIRTFHTNDMPPTKKDLADHRIQRFTIVTNDDKLVGSPKGNVYFPLMARPGESLYLSLDYLEPIVSSIPVVPPHPVLEITVYNDLSTSEKFLI